MLLRKGERLLRYWRQSLIVVLLGVCTSLAVALGCAAFSPATTWEFSGVPFSVDEDTWYCETNHWFGRSFTYSYVWSWKGRQTAALGSEGAYIPSWSLVRHHSLRELAHTIPDWVAHEQRAKGKAEAYNLCMYEDAAGWPWRCLTRHYLSDNRFPGFNFPCSSLDVGVPYLLIHHEYIDPQPLPTRPYWPGLAANSLVYGLAWSIPWIVAPWTRRTWRRKNNRCRACNYDLRGLSSSLCPECGKPATSTVTHT
jgi:hypothetical protein